MSSVSKRRDIFMGHRKRKRRENITVIDEIETDSNEQDHKIVSTRPNKRLKVANLELTKGNKKKAKKLTTELDPLLQKSTKLNKTTSPSSSTQPTKLEVVEENEKNVKKLTARLERLFRRSAQAAHLRKLSASAFSPKLNKNQKTARSLQASDIIKNNANIQGLDLYPKFIDNSNYLALDCEMVGVGPRKLNALARCSVTDYDGNVVLDEYVRPKERITDYRTKYSGILPQHMRLALPCDLIQERISALLQGKILVGHAVFNDLKVLNYKHPQNMIADTLTSKTLQTMAGYGPSKGVSLKKLSWALLGKKIQCRTHCSVEDARATMSLFKLVQQTWEKQHGFINKVDSANAVRNDSGYSSDDNSSFFSDEYWPEEMVDI